MFLRSGMMPFAIAAFCIALPPLAHAATAAPASALEVSGWIPYWRTASGTADALAHLDSLTEIDPFGYTVSASGDLYDAMGITQPDWAALIKAAKAKKVRVVPTVTWADTQAIHQILSNTASRIKLENEIANLVRADGFDGIDIDFENKLADDRDYFSTFLRGLYARMGNKWVMCSIEPRMPLADRYLDPSAAPADATDYANDYVAINRYCDRVRLMTYDQGTSDALLDASSTGPYVPVADPKWVADVVNLAAKTISKKKIDIGIATYGYEYRVTPLVGDNYRYDLQWALDPTYGLNLAAALGLVPKRNSADELSFLYTPTSTAPVAFNSSSDPITAIPATSYSPTAVQATQQSAAINLVWWSDAQAIADKVALAKQLGVRGVALFKIDGDEDPALWSVLPQPAR